MSTNTLIAVVVVAALVSILLDRLMFGVFSRPGKPVPPPTPPPPLPPSEKVTEQQPWPVPEREV